MEIKNILKQMKMKTQHTQIYGTLMNLYLEKIL